MSGSNQSTKKKHTQQWVQKTTKNMFPDSVKQTVSIQQLNRVFGEQMFGQEQKPVQKKMTTSISLSEHRPKRQVSTLKEDRFKELNRMTMQTLKDLCLTRYRIDCNQLKKKKGCHFHHYDKRISNKTQTLIKKLFLLGK
jgi:hypothetical protein